MQLFVWKFGGEERIRMFCMTRFITAPNIDKLRSCIEEIEKGGFKFKEGMFLDRTCHSKSLVFSCPEVLLQMRRRPWVFTGMWRRMNW